MNVNEQMRADWNRRAREDVHFYVAFGRRSQEEQEFLDSAAETMGALESEFSRLPTAEPRARKALEIGCGPGRLMRPMSRHFGEVHGVDIADEMIRLAGEQLRDIPNAHAHLTPDSNLGMFADGTFDLVYSYTVFQHIPDRGVVLNYLRESRRVLKPGGILRCQLRGTPPVEGEAGQPETWTGCYFTGEEVAAFAREHRFQLVAISGLQTQYMWVTLRKPATESTSLDYSRVSLKDVTAAGSGSHSIPQRGRDAAVSLWLAGMPEDADLAQVEIAFDNAVQQGCYLSPIGENGGCQINAVLPPGSGPGPVAVTLRKYHAGASVGPMTIEVLPGPAWQPKVLSVTDAINLKSNGRSDTGGVKVNIQDIEQPEKVAFRVDGRKVDWVQIELKDPIAFTYEFSFYVPRQVKNGERKLDITVSGRALPPVWLQVERS